MSLARTRAGLIFDWDELPPVVTSLADVPPGATALRFRREKASHRGIAKHGTLRHLFAYSVDRAFLEEISALAGLELLYVNGLGAADLSPLARLRSLKRLVLIGGTKVPDLEWTATLAPLHTLAIENFTRVESLEPLGALHSLRVLGVEGGIWTPMRVETLAPLARLSALEYLFLTNLRSADRSLAPLHRLAHLQALECGNLFARGELERLHQALPSTKCTWFDMIDEHGSVDDGVRAYVERFRQEGDSQ